MPRANPDMPGRARGSGEQQDAELAQDQGDAAGNQQVGGAIETPAVQLGEGTHVMLQDEHSQCHQDRRDQEDELPEVFDRQRRFAVVREQQGAPPSNWPSNSSPPPTPIQARPQPIISPSQSVSEGPA